jgi:hypothetical protein
MRLEIDALQRELAALSGNDYSRPFRDDPSPKLGVSYESRSFHVDSRPAVRREESGGAAVVPYGAPKPGRPRDEAKHLEAVRSVHVEGLDGALQTPREGVESARSAERDSSRGDIQRGGPHSESPGRPKAERASCPRATLVPVLLDPELLRDDVDLLDVYGPQVVRLVRVGASGARASNTGGSSNPAIGGNAIVVGALAASGITRCRKRNETPDARTLDAWNTREKSSIGWNAMVASSKSRDDCTL